MGFPTWHELLCEERPQRRQDRNVPFGRRAGWKAAILESAQSILLFKRPGLTEWEKGRRPAPVRPPEQGDGPGKHWGRSRPGLLALHAAPSHARGSVRQQGTTTRRTGCGGSCLKVSREPQRQQGRSREKRTLQEILATETIAAANSKDCLAPRQGNITPHTRKAFSSRFLKPSTAFNKKLQNI